ncbi:MAG: hypothetical protein INR64_19005, partial [Caulobacteraceae bacterium]|nr:hypothetical protein [Caulobacter sp.]
MDENVAAPRRRDHAAAGGRRRHLFERLLPGIGRYREPEAATATERTNALPEALLETAVVTGFENVRV